MTLDLGLRLRVHALMCGARRAALARGHRHHARRAVAASAHRPGRAAAAHRCSGCCARPRRRCRPPHELAVPSRTVRLPLSFDDPSIHEAISRYKAGVRDDAPWNPATSSSSAASTVWTAWTRCGGSSSTPSTSCSASATSTSAHRRRPPLDPRHRLVTTKYNPARTWTPEGARRYRRRVPVCLRHGGPRRVPAHRPHRADLVRAAPVRAVRAGCAVAAAVLRPRQLVSGRGQTNSWTSAPTCGPGAPSCPSRTVSSSWPTTNASLPPTPRTSPVPCPSGRRVRGGAVGLAGRGGVRPAAGTRAGGGRDRVRAARREPGRGAAVRQRVADRRAPWRRGGRRSGPHAPGGHEDSRSSSGPLPTASSPTSSSPRVSILPQDRRWP